jgi:hypothetical protein
LHHSSWYNATKTHDYLQNQPPKTLEQEWDGTFWEVNLLSVDLKILHFLKDTKNNTIVFSGNNHTRTIEEEMRKDGWVDCKILKDLFSEYELQTEKAEFIFKNNKECRKKDAIDPFRREMEH